MLNSLLMFLLPIKHGLLAHTLDIGYSGCRTGDRKNWWPSLVKHVISEISLTACLLHGHSVEQYVAVLVTECTALLTAMFIDRLTWFSKSVNVHHALIVHLLTETGLLALYVYLGATASTILAF